MADELIRMEHISKSYGSVQALTDVTLTVGESEIVGLLGDNGAGKSTLIKVLSGAIRPTSGEIYVRGRKVEYSGPRPMPSPQGIETIYQDSALVTQLSIARNLFLGREPVKGPRLLNRMDQAAMNRGRDAICCRRSASKRASRPPRRSAPSPAASARLWRLRGRCISTAI